MNIIKQDNQKAVIHLSRIGVSDFFLARAVVFTLTHNGSYSSHLVGIKRLSTEEATELRSQIDTLAQYNVTLIDADATPAEIVVATALLGVNKSVSTEDSSTSVFTFIPSPYASKIETLEAFLTSQKTRAPTR